MLQAVADILFHRHVWKQRIGLEHHVDRPLIGRNAGHVLTIDPDAAFGGRFKSGEHAQKRCLAAAGAAEEGKQFALVDIEAHIVDGYEVTEFLGDVFDPDERLARSAGFSQALPVFSVPIMRPQKIQPGKGAGLLWCQDGEPVLMVLQALVRARSRSELIDLLGPQPLLQFSIGVNRGIGENGRIDKLVGREIGIGIIGDSSCISR